MRRSVEEVGEEPLLQVAPFHFAHVLAGSVRSTLRMLYGEPRAHFQMLVATQFS